MEKEGRKKAGRKTKRRKEGRKEKEGLGRGRF